MRRFNCLLFFVVSIISVSCHRDYRQSITDYLKAKVINPQSLKILEFKEPDSIKTSFFDTEEYKSIKSTIDSLTIASKNHGDLAISYVGSSKEAVKLNEFLADEDYKKAERLYAVIKNRTENFKSELNGYHIIVIYQANNADGNLSTDTCSFDFDKKYSKITGANGIDL